METANTKEEVDTAEAKTGVEPLNTLDSMNPAEALRFYIRKVLDAIEASTNSEKQNKKPPAPPPRTLKMHLPPDAQQVLVFVIASGTSLAAPATTEETEPVKVSNEDARVRIVEQQGESSSSTVLVIDEWGGTKPYNDDIFTSENPGERIETVVVDVSDQVGKLPMAIGTTLSDSEDLFLEDDDLDWSPGAADADSSDGGVERVSTKKSLKRDFKSTRQEQPAKRKRLNKYAFICDECGEEFESESALDDHACQADDEEGYFICKFCGKKYNDQNEFWNHYRSHVKSNREHRLMVSHKNETADDGNNRASRVWECTDCEEGFRLRDELRLHRRENHPTKYTCLKCKEEFLSKDELTAHRNSAHPASPLEEKTLENKCADCQEIFDTPENLLEHCEETKHVSHVQCTLCEEKFSSRTDLRRHKRIVHQMRNSCPKCTEIFPTKQELFKHRDEAHPIVLECQKCEEKFSSREALIEHRKEAHPQKQHMCVFCERLFAKESTLKAHQALHLENPDSVVKQEVEEDEENIEGDVETKFVCEKCDRSFSSKLSFRKHNMISHGERLFACSICNIVLQSRKELVKHKESHKEKLVCEQCGRQYRHKRDLLRHIPTHSGERPYPCTTCGFRFHTAERLRNHQAIHKEKRYLCDLCPMKFTDGQHLRRHLKSHAYKQRQRVNSLIFRCLMCPATFDSPTRLQQHYNQEHPVAEFRCVECNIHVASFDLLKTHFRAQHKGKVIHCCRVCGDAFDKKQKFLTHRNRTHKAPRQQLALIDNNTTCSACQITFTSNVDYVNHLTDENEKCKEAAAAANREPEPKLYKCLPCNEVFPTSAHLATHSGIHSTKFPTACDICGVPLADAMKIAEHLTKHMASGTWSCTECNKTLSSRQSLRMHMGSHGVASPFTCPTCGKTFNSRNALETHNNIHTGNSPFRCNRCPAAYKQPIQLKAHLLSHDGRKMYECAECNKTFAARSSLVAHLGNHVSGQLDRPAPTFECTICGKVFDHKANLSNHLRTHNGEKGLLKKHFACDRCKRTFTTRAHLIIHEHSHDDINANSTCPVCQKKFKTVKALGLHMRIHTSESPMCPICNKSFTIQRSLEEHMELHDEQSVEVKCPNCNAIFRSQHSFHKHKAQCCSVYNSQICRQCGLGYTDIKRYEAHTKVCDHKQNRRSTENLYTLTPQKIEEERSISLPQLQEQELQEQHVVLVPVEEAETVVEEIPEPETSMIVADEACHLMVQNALQAIVGENLVHSTQEGAVDLEHLIEGQAPTELILDGPQGKVRVQFIYETTA